MNRTTEATAAVVKNPIAVMQRYELKYLMNREQTQILLDGLRGHMEPDQFGKTSIASLYYDTPDYRLIRTSVEKPAFKEKIRLRSYGPATEESPVFLELKRKASGIVYKRRVCATIPQVEQYFDHPDAFRADGQISREITTFLDYYADLSPSCLIIYDRTAYYEPDGDLRLTVDENPRYRTDDLRLTGSMEGTSLLPEGGAILELKVQSAIPLWLTEILSAAKIYRCSFSKYGEVYRRRLLNVQ